MTKQSNPDTLVFNYNQVTLAYQVKGSGPKTVLAFHGFGQTKEDFNSLANTLGDECTFFSFDLFYHGESLWNSSEALTNQAWSDILKRFIDLHNITKFSVCGFSIGARLALATILKFPEQINEVTLIAPDGISNNLWYKLATGPAKPLFKLLVNHPAFLTKTASFASKVGLIDKQTFLLAQSQLSNNEYAHKIYNTWTLLSGLKINIKQLLSLINKHHINTTIIIGERDKLIPQKTLNTLISKSININIISLNSNHTNLINKTAEYFRKKTS